MAKIFLFKPASVKCHIENERESTFGNVRQMIRGVDVTQTSDGAEAKGKQANRKQQWDAADIVYGHGLYTV